MSIKMKYLEFPQEIKDRIRELVGEEYDENFLDEHYAQNECLPASNKGFDYDVSSEGFNFWAQVINDQKFDVFFKKYPKNDVENFNAMAYPNEKVGTMYQVNFPDHDLHGQNVILRQNDGSKNPYFWLADKSDCRCIYWHRLRRVEQKVEVISSTFEDRAYPDEVEGTSYIVVKKGHQRYGQTVTLKRNDKTFCPYFYVATTSGSGTTTDVIAWKNLKRVTDKVEKSLFKIGDRVRLKANWKDIVPENWHDRCKQQGSLVSDPLTEDNVKDFESDQNLLLSFNGKHNKFSINYRKEWVEVVESQDQSEILNHNHNYGKESNNGTSAEFELCSISPTISTRPPSIGIAICYSGEEIRVGG